jgi:hypothetical protein
MDIIEIKAQLADINQHLMAVASKHPPESDINELAYAMHNLSAVLAEVAEQSQLPPNPVTE